MNRIDWRLLIIFVFVVGLGATGFFYLQHINNKLDHREHVFDQEIQHACTQLQDANKAFNRTLDVLILSTRNNSGLTETAKISVVLALTGLHLAVPHCPEQPS